MASQPSVGSGYLRPESAAFVQTNNNEFGPCDPTGRVHQSNPAIQNIPIRTELGTFIRQVFVQTNGTAQ